MRVNVANLSTKFRNSSEKEALKAIVEEFSNEESIRGSEKIINRCYSLAQKFKKKIPANALETSISSLKTHAMFNVNLLPKTDESFPVLFHHRNFRFYNSLLESAAEKFKVFNSAFPKFSPSAYFNASFPNASWEVVNGHPIPPNWALNSPAISIRTFSDKPALYTIALMDLDHQSAYTKKVQEWCHWLVSDIPITNDILIDSGSSPYIKPMQVISNHGKVGEFPIRDHVPTTVGNVVFDYVPPHPANSNPRLNHRLMFTLFRQTEKFDTAKLPRHDETIFDSSLLSEKEKEMRYLDRGAFSGYGLKNIMGLEMVGYGFFTTYWNMYTPKVFSMLGIHEPVFGKMPVNIQPFVDQTRNNLEILKDKDVTELKDEEIRNLNMGILKHAERVKLPTVLSVKAEMLREKFMKEAAKKGKEATVGIAVEQIGKLPRVTVVGSVGIVKKEEGIIHGEKTRELLSRRGKFQNV